MSCGTQVRCDDEERRAALIAAPAPLNGIEAIEIVPKPDTDPLVQRVLAVFFFRGVPSGLDNAHLHRFEIVGGTRIPGHSIRFVDARTVGNHLELTVDRYGDFSDYILAIDHPDLDPMYRCRSFNFKVDCPNPFDCRHAGHSAAPRPPSPPIDYLTKDYRSFRRALLDFLPTRVPTSDEGNEADLAVTLAELFAYVGDRLSYFQDAVANEAYFETARQRVSVKRHARLVDYRMHEGAAARTVLHFRVAGPVTVAAGAQVATVDEDLRLRRVFETEEAVAAVDDENEMLLHTWRNTRCCLPRGATSADLLGLHPSLVPGRLVLFEEVRGPVRRGDAAVLDVAAAERGRRQVVRLTEVRVLADPLQPAGQQDVTRVTWQAADALVHDFCLEEGATVARGNLARASDGTTVGPERLDLTGPTLTRGPLTWLSPTRESVPAWMIPPDRVDPRRARSTVDLTIDGEPWVERESLLDSRPHSPHFVVDVDGEGRGILRFGDGALGRKPPADAVIDAVYRIGNGSAGNVGADTLVRLVTAIAGVDLVRNPVPATGGRDPEPIADVRRDAPHAFRANQYRAVTAADYARSVTDVSGVSNAAATFRWTGSWLTVFAAIDAVGRTGVPDAVQSAVLARLESRRQAGYDLAVAPPRYVALEIALHLCVRPEYFQADVIRAVADALSSGVRVDGTRGFFHPDNFTFGDHLYLSRLYAAVQAVAGVRSVAALRFKRLHHPDYHELESGLLKVGPFEVVRLDGDPSHPDNGMFTLTADGGK